MITRRKLLGVLAGIAALGMPIGYYFLGKDKSSQWDFFKRQAQLLPFHTAEKYTHIRKNCVPLGPERAMVEGSEMAATFVKKVSASLESELANKGMDTKGDYDAIATGQSYGEPETPEISEKMLDYSKKAADYTYSRIKGLEKLSINWTVLKQGQDFGKNFDGNVYIGQKWYLVKRAQFKNRKKPEQKLTLIDLEMRFGGAMDFANTSEMGLLWWYAFIGSTEDSIKAPFSELLGRFTIRKMLKHYSDFSHDNALKANETIHESLSEILAREFVKSIGFDGAIPVLDSCLKSSQAKPLYSDVPKAILWAQKNSLQAAYDLYMESPKKYVEAIKSG
jgi:hypothetical protein